MLKRNGRLASRKLAAVGVAVTANHPAEALRVPAVPGTAAGKRRQRIHGKSGNGCPGDSLDARHVLLVKPGPLRQRVIADNVLLDEVSDGYADSGLHVPNLGTFAGGPKRSHYLSFRVLATRSEQSTRFSAGSGFPATA